MGTQADILVACVLRSGGPYTWEYVARLKDGVDQNLSGHEFVCLSDLDPPKGINWIRLTHGYDGWWSKIELFCLVGKVLYFDLDTVITGDLSEIANYPHRFTMLSDFYTGKPASGVMAWDGDYSRLLAEYDPSLSYPGHGDQGYIGSMVEADRFQDLFPGQITSRKVTKTRNPDERVVCFHGSPRPHEVDWRI